MTTPNDEGRQARLDGYALLSNPYTKGYEFEYWNDWRQGWLDEDRILRTGEDNQ